MTDLCHSRGPLLRGGVAADQLVLQVDLHHFAHQAIRRPANRGDLLQNSHTGLAGLQRALKGFDLAADASYAAERPFFIFRLMWHDYASVSYRGVYYILLAVKAKKTPSRDGVRK